jgi:hypothetical protein
LRVRRFLVLVLSSFTAIVGMVGLGVYANISHRLSPAGVHEVKLQK